MSLTRIFALGLALTFITGIASTAVATAKELRFPEIGDVAFVMDVPDNWVVSRVGPNLLLKGPDHSSSVALAVIKNKDEAKAPDDDLAKAIFKASNAEPFSKHEPGAIGGIKAEAYYSKTTNTKNLNVLYKLMIVKVAKTDRDHHHLIGPQRCAAAIPRRGSERHHADRCRIVLPRRSFCPASPIEPLCCSAESESDPGCVKTH